MSIKRKAFGLVGVAVVACIAGYGLRWYKIAHDPYQEQTKILLNPNARGQWAFGSYRPTLAQCKEWQIMRINLDYQYGLFWNRALGDAMLQKANWLADRLNLPVKRPIQPWEARGGFEFPSDTVLHQYPSWIPDTVYGMNVWNTNIPRLKRILALKFAVNGWLDTPTWHFSFMDGQCDCIARQSKTQGDANRLDEIMTAPHVHPPPLKTAEIYQIATNYLAAIGINLDRLEKSRLPHPVRQEEERLPGACPVHNRSILWPGAPTIMA